MVLRVQRFVAFGLLSGFSVLMLGTLLWSWQRASVLLICWDRPPLMAVAYEHNVAVLYFELAFLSLVSVWAGWLMAREMR